ncbi:MAG: hypothetical protein UU17_C0040G0014 [Candidatus Nomurabacteria bacterium GW2011_GWA1_40_8]|nr:MAG: hypothetical protein UU17_C0040G0014 [Candidatus Nomurabacteria bacterium GW2011_GWA1_40_8]
MQIKKGAFLAFAKKVYSSGLVGTHRRFPLGSGNVLEGRAHPPPRRALSAF